MNTIRFTRLLILIAAGFTVLMSTGCENSQIIRVELGPQTPGKRNTALAEQLNAQALTHMENEEWELAEPLLKRSVDADVMFGPAHNNLGKVHYHFGRMYKAAWEFQYASQLMPDQPEPRNNLALVFESVGKLDDAVAWYEKARDMSPDNAQVLGNLARARHRRGDRDNELRELLDEIVLKDDRPDWVDWAKEQRALLTSSQ